MKTETWYAARVERYLRGGIGLQVVKAEHKDHWRTWKTSAE
uniref:Uncharacterized protein n=1 Tax=Rhizophora mucronata TaxID=61149 RepID=A0A2P2QEF2_RHIMU